MRIPTYDAGGCVGCDYCTMPPTRCPQCQTVEVICDNCGGLVDADGVREDGHDYCWECWKDMIEDEEEDDDEL